MSQLTHDINMMNIRIFVKDLYHNTRWARRVDCMSDAQVFAIWKRTNKD